MSGTDISILQMNDSHGYLDIHQELFWDGNHAKYELTGGYSRIATIFNEIRNERSNTLIFDCGDTIHGTYPVVNTKGMAMIPILNELDFDAMTAHWEFAYGPDHFKVLAKNLNYPMLAINCYYKSNNKLVFEPFIIKEVDGLRIGIIGIAATILDKVMPESFSKGIYFTLGNQELPFYINKLCGDERVDLIVLISHLGLPQEIRIAKEIKGVDVLLSAHTHNRLYGPIIIDNTIIIQSGCHGSFIGRLDINFSKDKISNFKHELITVTETINPDPYVDELVNNVIEPDREWINQVVGYTSTDLNRNTVLESTMDNFLLKGILAETGAQIAFSNGWRYGAPILTGEITLNDIYNIIPVNPPVSTVELTGKEIWMMMEENLENTFSRDPFRQMGGYLKRCIGLNMYFKLENPKWYRIQEFFIQGKRLQMDKTYQAAYVTSQGVPNKYGKNRKHKDIHAVEALKNYLNKENNINADLLGTVVAI